MVRALGLIVFAVVLVAGAAGTALATFQPPTGTRSERCK
jgi:hypothetical protein